MTMRKHFVTFLSPGTFVSETNREEVAEWDVKAATKRAQKILQRYGAKPYGFRFSTCVRGVEVERSGMFFIDGEVESREDVLAGTEPDRDILRSNVRCNGWPAIVTTRTSYRHTAPFEEKDVAVDLEGNVVCRGSDYVKEAE